MKRYLTFLLLAVLVTGTSAPAYVNPMGNLSLEEVREAAGIREEKEEEKEYSDEQERISRSTSLWEDEEDAAIIGIVPYPDPTGGYGKPGEFRVIEALEYQYPDGTTEIISSDGRILKERE